jgi:hypothetical protein
VNVRIVGTDLPPRDWCDHPNVHVGIQRKQEVVERVSCDAGRAEWEIDVEVLGAAAEVDFRGPSVHGKKGDRFLYLSWGSVGAGGAFTMFRRAKLMLAAIDRATIEAACRPGHRLVGTLRLVGRDGGPVCAAVRPPAIQWTATR